VTILRLLQEGPERSFRIAAAAHIDSQEWITVGREVQAAIVVALRNVGRQREHAGRRFLLLPRRIQRCVELHAVTQRYFHAPAEVDLGGIRSSRFLGRDGGE
jgi:hypothetical protein